MRTFDLASSKTAPMSLACAIHQHKAVGRADEMFVAEGHRRALVAHVDRAQLLARSRDIRSFVGAVNSVMACVSCSVRMLTLEVDLQQHAGADAGVFVL